MRLFNPFLFGINTNSILNIIVRWICCRFMNAICIPWFNLYANPERIEVVIHVPLLHTKRKEWLIYGSYSCNLCGHTMWNMRWSCLYKEAMKFKHLTRNPETRPWLANIQVLPFQLGTQENTSHVLLSNCYLTYRTFILSISY